MPELPRIVILRGFQRGVDWKPTQLADHVPSTLHACSLCGGVQRTTTVLPCLHAFCSNCLQASEGASYGCETRCVLDGRSFVPEEDVVRKECSAQDAASLKVMCWNACYGCDFTGPVSHLPEHFEENCSFHPAVCPRCKVTMLLTDLPGHYRRGCMPPLERSELRHWDAQSSTPTAHSTWHEDVTLTAHDTLVGLESRMNELVEHVRNLDTKSTLMSLSLSEATDFLRQMASTHSSTVICKTNPMSPELTTLPTDSQENKRIGVSERSTTEGADGSVDSAIDTSAGAGRLSLAQQKINTQVLPEAVCYPPTVRRPFRRQTTQLTHYLSEQHGDEREKRAFLVMFQRTKPVPSGSASDFLPFYDLLKRGIELSIPETWTAKVVLDGNEDCHVKIVILEENAALDVYAKVEERRKTFNPWKVESVRLAHPTENTSSSSSTVNRLFKPTWTHSRAARLRFQASGYGFYGSNRFEAMCRRGFVLGNDTVTFCVTLMRKWNAPGEFNTGEGTSSSTAPVTSDET
nr:uncharacterized protein LOC126526350 [Dermacentor andersoni]